MPPTLRPYQAECLAALVKGFERGNPLAVLPTGAGKSHVIAELCRWAITSYPGTRIMIVAHVRELLEQNAAKVLAHWPEAPIDYWCAGLARKRAQPITCASIQSVYKSTPNVGAYQIVIIDEAHRIPHDGLGMYRQLIAEQREINPNLRLAGLTATPYRHGAGLLTEGDGALFDRIVYEAKISELTAAGYLSPIRGRRPADTQADMSRVHVVAGEYVADEMETAFRTGDLVSRTVTDILSRVHERRSILVFAAGVTHAREILAAFRGHGETRSGLVTGETSADGRAAAVRDFRSRALRVLVNCQVYTTGFDAPNVDCVCLVRATQSPGLYVQMVGRGSRQADGKSDCLLLDYGDNIRRHGPLDMVSATANKKSDRTQPARSKTCPSCGAEIATGRTTCPECKIAMPREVKHEDKASDADPMRLEVRVYEVSYMYVERHEKADKPPSMRVTYVCGMTEHYSEWVCFEHGDYPAEKARQWAARRGVLDTPATVDAAMQIKWPTPSTISVKADGKYDRVVGVDFHDAKARGDGELGSAIRGTRNGGHATDSAAERATIAAWVPGCDD